VLAGQEGLDLTPAKLTKLARDLVRLAAAEAGHAGARAAHHTRQLASWTRLGLSTVFSRAARRQGDGDGLADRLQTALRDHSVAIRRAYAPEALHGDRIFQGLIRQLIREVPIGSVVETGTYLGATTGWVASEHPTLPVYTCEIDPEFLGRARRRLWRLRNVRSTHASSERFVHRLLEGGRLMGIPLFFLDAHWQRYWPLRDELGVLAVSGKPAVIVIDDFRVPDRPEFGFDTWETEDGKQVCDFDLVAECLDLRNDHRLLVPAYEARDAFHAGERALLRGHLVIFQNLSEPHERLVSRGGVVSRHYVPVDLPPRP
jgi:predicted O-methyltransferase YrrM